MVANSGLARNCKKGLNTRETPKKCASRPPKRQLQGNAQQKPLSRAHLAHLKARGTCKWARIMRLILRLPKGSKQLQSRYLGLKGAAISGLWARSMDYWDTGGKTPLEDSCYGADRKTQSKANTPTDSETR